VRVDDHVAQVGQPVTDERRRVARGQVLLEELCEIDVEQDVGVVDDERAVPEHRLRVLERAAGPEDRILGEEHGSIAPG